MERLLRKYADRILDWDSDKDERTGDGGYFVYLKRPWVIKDFGYFTDMISESTIRDVERRLRLAYKDEQGWDSIP